MVGAGVFAAFAPAARAAGNGLLLGLGLAACVAYCNATSSAELAAIHPESGGAYVYGRKRLGQLWGFLAGSAFVTGKLASAAAMAMTFASYAYPTFARPLAVGAVLALTAVNYFGVQKTAAVTRVIVTLVLLALTTMIAAVWLGGATDTGRLWPLKGADPYGVLQSAGFLFFAFAGYARIATLGEEVTDPRRVIPRAVPLALALALVVYAAVGVTVLAGTGADAVATATAPLTAAVEAGRLRGLAPIVRIGAAVASLGVLLSLIAAVSRTLFAMSSNGDAPRFFSAVHPHYRVPHRAELAIGGLVAAICLIAEIREAIGFSSFAVLAYYAVANASAWTLAPNERRWPRALAVTGLAGCLVLAFTLPLGSVVGGVAVLAVAAATHFFRTRGSYRVSP